MNSIDEKGRIFGVINIIDLTAILFLLSTATGFWWLIHTGDLFRDFDPNKKEFVYKEVDVLVTNQSPSIIPTLEKEITRQMPLETTPVKILNITTVTPAASFNEFRNNIEILHNDYLDITLHTRLKTRNDISQNVYYYTPDPQRAEYIIPLQPGSLLPITTGVVNLDTTIISLRK